MHNKTKLSRLALILTTIAFLPWLVQAQAVSDQQQLRTAIDEGHTQTALTALEALRDRDPERFVANNYDYLLGRLQERFGKAANAAATYQANVDRNSILAAYSLWHLAKISRANGDLVREREQLRLLINTAPNSLLRESALMRLGQSFLESQDFKGASGAFRQLIVATSVALGRESQALLGESLLKAGSTTEAHAVFTRLVMQMPDAARPDDFALTATRVLDRLDAGTESSSKVAELAEAEHLLRASVYQFNRDFDAARLHYAAVVARFPNNPTVPNALYQIGRGYYLQQKYEEALKYFQRVLAEFPESSSARDALTFSAGSYNRLKRTDEAIAAYKLYTTKYATEPNPERPFLNIIDALHEAGRHKEALDWVQQTRVRFRGRIGDALAQFAQLRIHLAQGAWQEVVADANELANATDLGGVRIAGGATQSEVTFLRSLALEQLGRTSEAVAGYLSLTEGRNDYYSKRATQRLLALAADTKTSALLQTRASSLRSEAETLLAAGKTEEARRAAQTALRLTADPSLRDETLKLIRRVYEALPSYKLPEFKLVSFARTGPPPQPSGASAASHRQLAEELFFLGLYDEAIPELAASSVGAQATNQPLPKVSTPVITDHRYSLAFYELSGGHANEAIKFGEELWKTIPSDYVMELAPRTLMDFLYPLPYYEELSKHATPRGVDPSFVISIARQESRFQPAAKSVAAARGLMQFIAETSNATAGEIGLKDFQQDDLYNPDTAILFGSQYLAGLFKQFPGQPQAVAAAYNGGPENVARWIARSRSNDPDRYVSEIGFAQTKDYVFKVMLNYWQYQQLYDEKLQRR